MRLTRDDINNYYFEWLFNLMCEDRYSEKISYRKLLMFLHSKPFRFSILKDENRAEDGVYLRCRFAYDYLDVEDADEYIDGPCSVLEMMVALSIRCEENIMDDPKVGDRTKQWFWGMITNLGLGSMNDNNFNKQLADYIIERFLDREYEPNGRGGLFTIRNSECDLRAVEIWVQLLWYLDTIT